MQEHFPYTEEKTHRKYPRSLSYFLPINIWSQEMARWLQAVDSAQALGSNAGNTAGGLAASGARRAKVCDMVESEYSKLYLGVIPQPSSTLTDNRMLCCVSWRVVVWLYCGMLGTGTTYKPVSPRERQNKTASKKYGAFGYKHCYTALLPRPPTPSPCPLRPVTLRLKKSVSTNDTVILE